ncbi:MAG: hypothetical protein IPG96_08065 [Proteobacteria bacterium]|nr:hypothetical protein [Pseudomonadota bacterium]
MLQIIGRTAAGTEPNQVAIREFEVRGVQKATVRLLPNDHDADRDGFPSAGHIPIAQR